MNPLLELFVAVVTVVVPWIFLYFVRNIAMLFGDALFTVALLSFMPDGSGIFLIGDISTWVKFLLLGMSLTIILLGYLAESEAFWALKERFGRLGKIRSKYLLTV